MRADGLCAQEIADRLNELGITTQSGNAWQRGVVAQKLRRLASRCAKRIEHAAGAVEDREPDEAQRAG
jgi:hypothetical protein